MTNIKIPQRLCAHEKQGSDIILKKSIFISLKSTNVIIKVNDKLSGFISCVFILVLLYSSIQEGLSNSYFGIVIYYTVPSLTPNPNPNP